MKWARILIFVILLYGTLRQPIPLSSFEQKNKIDDRVEILENFFKNYNSPLVKNVETFIQVADKYGLDWKLLPVVACVESSCGKHYKNNAFGWGSDKLDYGSDSEDIVHIASRIASMAHYKAYKENQDLYTFAIKYNAPFAEDYYKKLSFFYGKLNYELRQIPLY